MTTATAISSDIANMLRQLNWEPQTQDFDTEGTPRPMWTKCLNKQGVAKLIIGARWTTGWLLDPPTGGPNSIKLMKTVATRDIAAVRALAIDMGGMR